MEPPRSVAVLGLGLMGGSLARDLAALGAEVLGYDADPDTLDAAHVAGAIHSPLLASLAGVERAELLVVAAPVGAAGALLERALPRLAPGCALTDLGSTKRSIARAVAALGAEARFVGSHPLAGDHRSGWAASRAGLFRDAPVYLCPTPRTADPARRAVRALWTALGARPLEVDPESHDRTLAWTSHLPQLASSALAAALAGAGVPADALGPGGRDATRLAASSPALWRAIALDNADLLLPALAALQAELAGVRTALEAGDAAAVEGLLARARAWRAG